MTDFTWDGGGDNVAWSDEDNWDVGSGFPDDNGDRAIFDATADAVVTGAARTIGELQINVGFTGSLTITVGNFTINDTGAHDGSMNVDAGTFDANDFDIKIDGDVDLNDDTVNMGSGTWTVGGNWDSNDIGSGLNEETSTVKMTGTGKTFRGGASSAFKLNTVEIASGATITTLIGQFLVNFTCNGQLNIDTGDVWQPNNGDITIGASGKVTGVGTLRHVGAFSAKTFTLTAGGIIDVATLIFEQSIIVTAGTYDSASVTCKQGTTGNRTITLAPGATIFTGSLTIETDGSGIYTVSNSTNDPNIEVRGDLTIQSLGATLTYDEGTGTITLAGSSLQTIDVTDAGRVEAIVVTNVSAGGVTFADKVDTSKITATSTAANIFLKFDETAAHVVDEFDITGTGNFRVELSSEVAANQWDVVTIGNQSIDHAEVQDSNMSGGTYTVTAGMDNGNNSANWVFVQDQFRTSPLVNAFRTQPVINAFRTQPIPM